MKLKDLLKDIYHEPIPQGFDQVDVISISSDSRAVDKASIFVALKGPIQDGKLYINDAIERGARIITTKAGERFDNLSTDVCVLEVEDTKKFLTELLLKFYKNAPSKIKTIGITGTNGKTTLTYLLESIFQSAKRSSGVVGTINYRYHDKIFTAKNTTPGLIDIHRYLYEMVESQVQYCFMEVSSHALSQGRVDGIDFHMGVWTNLTSDHLDYHHTTEEYFQAKSLLFKNLSSQASAIINADDPYNNRLIADTKCRIITYGVTNHADIMAKNIQMDLTGLKFQLTFKDSVIPIESRFIGLHNVYNILASCGVALVEGIAAHKIKEGVRRLEFVPGRLQRIDCGQDFFVFLDYAHTEDALQNVLRSLKTVCKGGKIILVFGCGGDRDKGKRPKMAKAAEDLADIIYVTNDNPRTEDPEMIIKQILLGFEKNKHTVIMNRQQAIYKALDKAQKADVVLIAGKGHENYQIFKDKRIEFDEKKIIENYLQSYKNKILS